MMLHLHNPTSNLTEVYQIVQKPNFTIIRLIPCQFDTLI